MDCESVLGRIGRCGPLRLKSRSIATSTESDLEEMAVRPFLFSIMTGALLASASCGGRDVPAETAALPGATSAATPAGTAAQPGATPAAGAACVGSGGTPVNIADSDYDPGLVTVPLGSVATWTNADETDHTVTFSTGPDCGRVAPGQSLSRTFDTAGLFIYRCTIHASMRGTVVVIR